MCVTIEPGRTSQVCRARPGGDRDGCVWDPVNVWQLSSTKHGGSEAARSSYVPSSASHEVGGEVRNFYRGSSAESNKHVQRGPRSLSRSEEVTM